MRKFNVILAILFIFISISPAHAVTNKLTIYYEANLNFAYSQSVADQFVADLDSGAQSCKSMIYVLALKQYDPDNLNPLAMGQNYKVKNENGQIISSGKFKPKFVRQGGMGSYLCRVEVTLNLPKAKFYEIEDSDGDTLISALPASKFKKNALKIDIFDWN